MDSAAQNDKSIDALGSWDMEPGILVVDRMGTIEGFDRACEKIFMYQAGEIVGKNSTLLFSPSDVNGNPASLLAKNDLNFSSPLGLSGTRKGRRKNGELFVMGLNVSSFKLNDGLRSVGVVRVLTNQGAGHGSRELLAAVVADSDDAIYTKSLDGQVTTWNKGAERLFGYTADEMIGANITKIFAPDVAHEAELLRRRIRLGERVSHLDVIRVSKSGQIVEVSLTLSPLFDEKGNLAGFSGIEREIGQKRRSEERFRQVVEAAPTALIVTDSNGMLRMVNSQTEKLFGYSRSELLGSSLEMLVPQRFRVNHHKLREHYSENPGLRAMGAGRDLFGVRKDGTEIPMEIGLSKIETEEGPCVLASLIDITERRKIEAKISRYTEELEHSNQALDEFAYIASHDLKEPVRGMANHVSLLLSEKDAAFDAGQRTRLERISFLAQRLGKLVDDLLNYSRLGRMEVSRQPVDLEALVRDVSEVVSASVTNRTVEIRIVESLPTVLGDMVALRELFRNLIVNGIKYNNSETAEISVGMHDTLAKDSAKIFYVRDNGIGIDKKFHKDMFKLFKRLHRADEYGGGTGSGLTFAQKIVERHGGNIWVESILGQGSTFYFSLGSE